LLFLFFAKISGKQFRSFMVALLFAVHPLNVESVAWVAERKNLLCTTFWLLSMLAYVWYARKPQWRRYLAVAVFFALALMAKPMAVTMPFVLLLLDFWPLGRMLPSEAAGDSHHRAASRFGTLLLEKAPLLALAAISSWITMKAQQGGRTVAAWTILPLGARLKNAAVAYLAYIGKMFWPAKLAVMYPHRGNSILLAQALAAALALVIITVVAVAARRKGYLLMGWLWYLGTMVPVIGLVQVGDQAMADRYAYVPIVGLFVMIVWAIADWASEMKGRQKLVAAAAAIGIVALVWQCSRQIGYWQNSLTLFTHAVGVTQGNFHAEVNLGGALEEMGRQDEAMQHFYAAVADNPKFGLAHYDIGIHLQRAGKLEEAAREYELATANERDPETQARGENNLGYCLIGLSRSLEAERHFRRAIELDPYKFNSHYGLGHLLLERGRLAEAAMHLTQAAAILPTDLDYFDLGRALEGQKKLSEAERAYQTALRLRPNFPDAQQRLNDVEHELSNETIAQPGRR
jgi:tetratricopeptide (TPR) repeat protein